MAFVVVMATDRNHAAIICQRHVTDAVGNLLFPLGKAATRLKSQSVRPLFDTLKAKALMLDAGKNMSDLARANWTHSSRSKNPRKKRSSEV